MAVNEQARTEQIARLLEAENPPQETMRVTLRGRMAILPVIRVSLESTVLNPNSHRIRAQLESNHEAHDAIQSDPDGDVAQEHIRNLLRATPGFQALKQNIFDVDQKVPGIITRTGRLINGNTRAVALADKGAEYMDVAVLPAATTITEIVELELELQVAQDFLQPYSFTNELLFVDDLISQQGLSDEQVAERLHWATPSKATSLRTGKQKVQSYVRHLALIREIQAMSGGVIPLTDFDDAEQALQEFDVAYESKRNRSPDQAEKMKKARTLGLLAGLGYERQRPVDADWVETYFVEAVEESDLLRDAWEAFQLTGSAEVDDGEDLGLGGFEDDSQLTLIDDAKIHSFVTDLTRRLGRTGQDENVNLGSPSGEVSVSRETLRVAINEAMRSASEDAKSASKAGDALLLPAHHAGEAAKHLSKAAQTFRNVGRRQGFDSEKFADAFRQVQRALEALQQTAEI